MDNVEMLLKLTEAQRVKLQEYRDKIAELKKEIDGWRDYDYEKITRVIP